MKRILSVLVLALAGCMTTPPGGPAPSATDQAISAAGVSYKALDTAILAADGAVKSGVLKGQDAKNALDGLTKAKVGLDLALTTLRAANAAAGAPK